MVYNTWYYMVFIIDLFFIATIKNNYFEILSVPVTNLGGHHYGHEYKK